MNGTSDRLLFLEKEEDVSWVACELITNRLRARPQSRVALASGRTPLGTYELLTRRVHCGCLSFSSASLFMLDEFCGLPASDPRSFRSYFQRHLNPLGFASLQELNGSVHDTAAECARYQDLLDEAPLDLVLLGLGRNGHIAFNEPGSTPSDGVRRVELDRMTRYDTQEAFGGIDKVPTHALTLGPRDLLRAREILIIACGESKREAIRELLTGSSGRLGGLRERVSGSPAALLKEHKRLTILCDRAAREG